MSRKEHMEILDFCFVVGNEYLIPKFRNVYPRLYDHLKTLHSSLEEIAEQPLRKRIYKYIELYFIGGMNISPIDCLIRGYTEGDLKTKPRIRNLVYCALLYHKKKISDQLYNEIVEFYNQNENLSLAFNLGKYILLHSFKKENDSIEIKEISAGFKDDFIAPNTEFGMKLLDKCFDFFLQHNMTTEILRIDVNFSLKLIGMYMHYLISKTVRLEEDVEMELLYRPFGKGETKCKEEFNKLASISFGKGETKYKEEFNKLAPIDEKGETKWKEEFNKLTSISSSKDIANLSIDSFDDTPNESKQKEREETEIIDFCFSRDYLITEKFRDLLPDLYKRLEDKYKTLDYSSIIDPKEKIIATAELFFIGKIYYDHKVLDLIEKIDTSIIDTSDSSKYMETEDDIRIANIKLVHNFNGNKFDEAYEFYKRKGRLSLAFRLAKYLLRTERKEKYDKTIFLGYVMEDQHDESKRKLGLELLHNCFKLFLRHNKTDNILFYPRCSMFDSMFNSIDGTLAKYLNYLIIKIKNLESSLI